MLSNGSAAYTVGLILALLLIGYLFYALFKPEDFWRITGRLSGEKQIIKIESMCWDIKMESGIIHAEQIQNDSNTKNSETQFIRHLSMIDTAAMSVSHSNNATQLFIILLKFFAGILLLLAFGALIGRLLHLNKYFK